MPPPSVRLSARDRAIAAILLTVIQIGLAFIVARGYPRDADEHFAIRGFVRTNAYELLCAADCLWYAAIAHEGYHSSIPPMRIQEGESNVAFFPAFPIMVRATYHAVSASSRSISWPSAALLASQIATVGFWFVLLSFMRAWELPPGAAALIVFAMVSHPSSFFMIAGHSESLYLLGIVGMLWCGEFTPAWGAIPGAIVGATRLLGCSFIVYPAMRGLRAHGSRRLGWFISAAGICLGGIAFLVYCNMRFGMWDLYFQTQHLGWGHLSDYWFFLRPGSYRLTLPFRKTVVTTLVALSTAAVLEWWVGAKDPDRERTWTRRALLLSAFAQFYLAGAGGARTDRVSTPFVGFGRYTLPIGLLVALVFAGQWRSLHLPRRAARAAVWAILCTCLGSLIFMNVLREEVTHFRR
jgi:hypothetical protein